MNPSVAILIAVAASALVCQSAHAQAARDYVYVVGSSTVFPFATVVAERFGRRERFRTPKVEATGSGGGFRLFCDGIGVGYPDVVGASRQIKPSERARCAANGVDDIVELKIGYDGIVFANSSAAPTMRVTTRDMFLALAELVPAASGAELIPNPYRRWSDIASGLPAKPILVYGPPPTSGTRDELVELAMQSGCETFAWIRALKQDDYARYQEICHSVREDGAYVEAGENDNLIVQQLASNRDAFGIFGYSFLDQNRDAVQGSEIDGVAPAYETIEDRSYPIVRPLFLYVKQAHVGTVPGLYDFMLELSSERAWGSEGYLVDRGLIALSSDERQLAAQRIRSLPYQSRAAR